MPSITEVRVALASRLDDGIPEFTITSVPLSSPTPPSGHVLPDTIAYHDSMGGGQLWGFRIQIFMAYTSDAESIEVVERYLQDGGIAELLEEEPTLGGLVSDTHVDRAEYRQWEDPVNPMIGCEFFIRVLV